MYIIKYRRDGGKSQYLSYKTERGMMNKVKELNDDPLIISVRIFKEITYGEQQSLFDAAHCPF
jgi:hypothetical protein